MATHPPALPRLSRPLSDLDGHYDVVVVGSGYGGSIAASRLARAGRRVALLERGREMHPGEFPRTMMAARANIQLSTADREWRDRSGLFWFHVDGDMNVFTGCGLGGTSLVNANVSVRPDDRVFDDPLWPSALRHDRASLEAAYARAEQILRPVEYPGNLPPLEKTGALEDLDRGSAFRLARVNVTFESGPNPVGIHQDACNGCGDCVTGCNVGSKNTLLMNYLPDAVAHGAAIFTEMDVRWIERTGRHWTVMADPLHQGRPRPGVEPLPVSADVVVLAAGSLGSTAILLRSAQRGLALSSRVGARFSGNGDVLGYAYRADRRIRGVGAGPDRPDPQRPAGACITAMLDERGGRPLSEGLIVEDAVIPGLLAPLVPELLLAQTATGWRRGHRGEGPWSSLESTVTRGRRGLLQHLQTFLVMGHDDGGGRIVLNAEGEARVEWAGAGRSEYYRRANQRLRALAESRGGDFLTDPIWTDLLDMRLVTVHPLGGCVMADRAEDGAVDHKGRVFDGRAGTSVHDGLYVWDGSIVPRSLGANPLFTISALAERAVALAAAERGWAVDYALGAPPDPGTGGPADAASGTSPVPEAGGLGLRFTEHMAGWWDDRPGPAGAVIQDYLDAETAGRDAGRRLSFELTMSATDVRAVIADVATPMAAVGTVDAPALSPEPILAEHGRFRLLVADDPDDPAARHMRYEAGLVTVDGRVFHLDGFKVVQPGAVGDAWPDTTTLYVTIRGGGPDGPVAGRGVLRISAVDFARLLRSMAVTGDGPETDRLGALAAFARAFAGPLVDDYATVVHHSVRGLKPARPRPHRPLAVPPRREHHYRSGDGVDLRLTRYRGGDRGPVVLVHGMGANPLTFSLDTIRPNLLEYLCGHGFDVWLQEWRGSTQLEASAAGFDADQVARFDHPAAEALVRAETGRTDLHWVTHCVGSLTWMMAALAGWTTPASLLCSQVGVHPVGPLLTRLKAGVRAAPLLRRAGVRLLTTDSFQTESRPGRLFDLVLRLYPVPREEHCDSAVCRRLAFIYGVAVHDAAVDRPTHAHLHELFGRTNMQMMSHLALCAHRELAVGAAGEPAYVTEENRERLRLPITFISGEHNLVWLAESTRRTHEWITDGHGSGWSQRLTFADHGHQDSLMGFDAARHTFPAVLAHLERAGA